MNPYADFIELFEITSSLIDDMPRLAREAAERRAEYDVARKKRELYYRDVKDRPVGMLKHLVDGCEDIAGLKIAADVAQATADANHERIMLNKKLLSSVQDWERREYGRSSNANQL